MPLKSTASSEAETASPDYVGLVKFLVQPFLESPESIRVDCEPSLSDRRVWVRLAFEATDKGRVFGRGGRNIQAIRTVLNAAAAAAGQTLHLDIYGSQSSSGSTSSNRNGSSRQAAPKRRDRPSRNSDSEP